MSREATCGHAHHYARGLCAACYKRAHYVRSVGGETSRGRTPRWTPDEERALAIAWAEGGLHAAVKALGRTVHAVRARAASLGLPPPAPGCITISAFAKASGYTVKRIERAIRDLGLAVAAMPLVSEKPGRRPGRAVRSALTPAQQRELVEHLRASPLRSAVARPGGAKTPAGQWGTGRKPHACVRCGTTAKRHKTRGYCTGCVQWARRRGLAGRRAAPYEPAPPVPADRAPPPLPRATWSPVALDDTPQPEAIAKRIASTSARNGAHDVASAVLEAFDEAGRAGTVRYTNGAFGADFDAAKGYSVVRGPSGVARGREATCGHEPHYAKGLCKGCYKRAEWARRRGAGRAA